tara:strand:- start:1316 stop:2146 length:831 start_codon:yes stop_codon:yes gene_type:complete
MSKNPLGTGEVEEVEEDEVTYETAEDLEATLKPKYQTMADLLETYRARPEVFRKGARDVERAFDESISLAEKRGDQRLQESKRAGAGVGSALTEEEGARLLERDANLRSEAAKLKMDAEAQALQAEAESLEKDDAAREELEAEESKRWQEFTGMASNTVAVYQPDEDGEAMFPVAFDESLTIEDPKDWATYWATIWSFYNEWEVQMDFDIDPRIHPQVKYNILVGNHPLEGMTVNNFREMWSVETADKYNKLTQEFYNQQVAEGNEESIKTVTAKA